MVATVNANTTTGVVVTSDTSGALALQTANTTALTISSGQLVTISSETISPQLTVGGVVATGVAAGVSLRTGSTKTAWLVGAQFNVNNAFEITPSTAAGGTTFSTPAITINTNGAIALTGAVTTATGVGITFPATQSASSNANTLDDYEEGSWAYDFTATSGTITKSTTFANGQYIKIGRQVSVTGFLQATAVSSPSGVLTVTGLPFVVTSVDARSGFCGGGIYGNLLSTASVSPLMINTTSGLSSFTISKFVTGSSANLAGDVIADSRFQLSFTYFTD